MFANPNLIYYDTFVLCPNPRLFVCLRMWMSSSQQYSNVYVKSIFKYPESIAGVPFDSARRFRASLLPHLHLCAFQLYSSRQLCGFKTKKKKLVGLYICVCECQFQTKIIKQNIKIIPIAGVPSSQALLGYLITAPPSVCIPDVIGVLAVWIRNPQKKNPGL